MVRQNKLKLLHFLLEDEEKFNDSWHWPPWMVKEVLVTANSSNAGNEKKSALDHGLMLLNKVIPE